MSDDREDLHDDIVKPMSAYHHFNRLNGTSIKDEMIREGT